MFDPDIFTDMDCTRMERRRSFLLFVAAVALSMLLGFFATYLWAEHDGRHDLMAASNDQLHRAFAKFEREIDKLGILPLTVAMDQRVGSFLAAADRGAQVSEINQYLATLNMAAGTLQVYLVDAGGTVIASSNWADSSSFVGRNISYRPYVQNAKAGSVTGYYGIGTTANTPGYFLATAVERDGVRIGTVAVKLDLEQLEHDWLNGMDQLMFMTDANRVIVLSSRAAWKYHSLGPLDAAKIAELNQTQQYNSHVMDALDWQAQAPHADGTLFVTVGDGQETRSYLADTLYVPPVGMDLTVLVDYSSVKYRAAEAAVTVALLILVAALIMRFANQRRLTIQERLLARKVLQEAYEHLKGRFEDRNRQLNAANEELRREVAERIAAARKLQSFQDELIRTENLAVIGQLSAGLAHEINQPLAALSTLSENAIRFLELNDTGTVKHNLGRICDLVRRMGVLTGQLRSFARRTDGEVEPVNLELSVESAIALLGHRLKKENVQVALLKPAHPVQAMADGVRLEQVLVNLISNAMDALSGNGEPKVGIAFFQEGDRAIIEVTDNGHGLSAEVLARLFEPFFTTKKTSGLGLGLAISQDIIRGFGGDLTAANRDCGGAMFRIVLPAAPTKEFPHE
ncbi:ATP-binding protein [Niveispirillum sp. BGYR6]|uniref:sensor histidine kinase n=1 Tax=Niveispirillum sp. BGYR6 TaxID=2971249 RepID=UPI0022B9A386|nr:ATP-binding protein [Niveispirillum sp. BGYR6]MDG5496216.1 ATP-binding protein [Niveispirillum sp. BGYR6]